MTTWIISIGIEVPGKVEEVEVFNPWKKGGKVRSVHIVLIFTEKFRLNQIKIVNGILWLFSSENENFALQVIFYEFCFLMFQAAKAYAKLKRMLIIGNLILFAALTFSFLHFVSCVSGGE